MAAVELGGTKVLAAVATDPLAPLRSARIATRGPRETLDEVASFLDEVSRELGAPEALGIASFGPIGIRREAADWGRMGRSNKAGWAGADVVGPLAARLGCPVALDTDVNGAALAEARWGAGRGLASHIYLTVGTGIGGGLVYDGRVVHGAMHPEMGHVRLRRHPSDSFEGCCAFHKDCAEGLASGPAILARFGRNLDALERDHPFRAVFADYLGQLCATLVLVASPERIVIGGGVMPAGGGLHTAVDRAMREWLAGYVDPLAPDGGAFIVASELGDHAGLAGAFALAQDTL